jgi:hypothetical protein
MIKEFGWHFPVRNLGNIVFKHRLNTEDEWQLTITKFGSYQGVSVAKVAKLKHSTQPIKNQTIVPENFAHFGLRSHVKMIEKLIKST